MSTAAARMPRPTRWEEPQGDRLARRARRRRALARAGLVASVVGAFVFVAWRQPVGVERQQALSAVEAEIAVADAEITDLNNRLQALRTRAHVTREAARRLGMHVARDDEIVMLPIPASAALSESTGPASSAPSGSDGDEGGTR